MIFDENFTPANVVGNNKYDYILRVLLQYTYVSFDFGVARSLKYDAGREMIIIKPRVLLRSNNVNKQCPLVTRFLDTFYFASSHNQITRLNEMYQI